MMYMFGLLSHPTATWTAIHNNHLGIGEIYRYLLILIAIPIIAAYIGTTMVGWQIDSGDDAMKLTQESAMVLLVSTYLTMLLAIYIIGRMILWMAPTYQAQPTLSQCIALAAYVATPLFIAGLLLIYPVLWLDLLVALMAASYAVYLLYTGLPIMLEVKSEQGFLYASAVLALGLVSVVGLLAATIILWNSGIGPVYTQ